MQYSIKLLAAGLVAQTGFTWAAPQARNFIYIVPDGYGQASQTMARDYASLQRTGSNASAPIVEALAGDRLVRTQTTPGKPISPFFTYIYF